LGPGYQAEFPARWRAVARIPLSAPLVHVSRIHHIRFADMFFPDSDMRQRVTDSFPSSFLTLPADRRPVRLALVSDEAGNRLARRKTFSRKGHLRR